MILQTIDLDYALHPHLCWFKQTKLRYSEWLKWFENHHNARWPNKVDKKIYKPAFKVYY